MSKRNSITSLIINQLKNINGNESSYDSSFTYTTNVFNNVFRGFLFLDGINDFPSIFVVAGTEVRIYHSDGFTEGVLPIALRLFVNSSNSRTEILDLITDIEHVIYNLTYSNDVEIEDITIESSSTDEGLLDPYGFGEINLICKYVL